MWYYTYVYHISFILHAIYDILVYVRHNVTHVWWPWLYSYLAYMILIRYVIYEISYVCCINHGVYSCILYMTLLTNISCCRSSTPTVAKYMPLIMHMSYMILLLCIWPYCYIWLYTLCNDITHRFTNSNT